MEKEKILTLVSLENPYEELFLHPDDRNKIITFRLEEFTCYNPVIVENGKEIEADSIHI